MSLKKMIKLSFVRYKERTIKILTLVHTDIYGPFDVSARGGYFYFIIFVDNFSWYGYVYLMRHKSKAFKKFKKFRSEVKK